MELSQRPLITEWLVIEVKPLFASSKNSRPHGDMMVETEVWLVRCLLIGCSKSNMAALTSGLKCPCLHVKKRLNEIFCIEMNTHGQVLVKRCDWQCMRHEFWTIYWFIDCRASSIADVLIIDSRVLTAAKDCQTQLSKPELTARTNN